MRTRSLVVSLVALAAPVTLLAACGDDDEVAGSATEETTTIAPADATTTVAEPVIVTARPRQAVEAGGWTVSADPPRGMPGGVMTVEVTTAGGTGELDVAAATTLVDADGTAYQASGAEPVDEDTWTVSFDVPTGPRITEVAIDVLGDGSAVVVVDLS